jgi:ParB-like chromosome segregation protein Spo0J
MSKPQQLQDLPIDLIEPNLEQPRQYFDEATLQIGARVGRHKNVVSNLMRLLQLSDEILELMERGEFGEAHGRALLIAKDPEARQELARAAIEQGWSTRELSARAHESNMSEPKPKEDPEEVGLEGGRERERDAGQARERDADLQPDLTVMDVARVWGDLLGVEVGVRTLGGRKLRLEAEFPSAEAALNVGGHLTDLLARAKKRR